MANRVSGAEGVDYGLKERHNWLITKFTQGSLSKVLSQLAC